MLEDMSLQVPKLRDPSYFLYRIEKLLRVDLSYAYHNFES